MPDETTTRINLDETTGGADKSRCTKCDAKLDAAFSFCPFDGTPVHGRDDEAEATVCGDANFTARYELMGLIGTGGMGVIYKARQKLLDKIVAVKMLHPYVVSQSSFARFQIEGRATSALSHPYIVTVHDFGTNDMGQPYLVMDYIEGRTLSDVLSVEGGLTIQRFRHIFLQVCDALSHAHQRSVLHRDVKPGNIMLVKRDDDTEEVRIMDFGVAKLLNESGNENVTKTGDTLGSPAYMSPEQGRGLALDPRSDIYSLGCVMYESLSGTPPFTGNSPIHVMMSHVNDDPMPLHEASLGKHFPRNIERLVMRMLQKDPNERFQSMEDVKTALLDEGDADDKYFAEPSEKKAKVNPQDSGNWRTVAFVGAGMVGVLALTAALSWWMISGKDETTTNKPMPGMTKIEDPGVNDLPTTFKEMTAKQAIAVEAQRKEPKMAIDRFSFHDLPIEDADLEPMKNDSHLRVFSITDIGITDAGLQYIKNLQLQELNLVGTDVKTLSALQKMTTLRALNLTRTDVTKAGLSNISHLPLETLRLHKTLIDDNDLKELYNIKTLRELDLTNCEHLTIYGYWALKEHLPKCKIVFATPQFFIDQGDHYLDTGNVTVADHCYLSALELGDMMSSPVLTSDARAHDRSLVLPLCHAAAAHAKCLQVKGLYAASIAAYADAKRRHQIIGDDFSIGQWDMYIADNYEKLKLIDAAYKMRKMASFLFKTYGPETADARANAAKLQADRRALGVQEPKI